MRGAIGKIPPSQSKVTIYSEDNLLHSYNLCFRDTLLIQIHIDKDCLICKHRSPLSLRFSHLYLQVEIEWEDSWTITIRNSTTGCSPTSLTTKITSQTRGINGTDSRKFSYADISQGWWGLNGKIHGDFSFTDLVSNRQI